MERVFQYVCLATLTRSSGSMGRFTDQAFVPSSVEESLLFAGTLYSGFHSNITAGSFFLFTCSRSWENVNLLFKCPYSPLSPRTRRKKGVSFERWSARLPVQRWDPPSVVQEGVWLMHMPPGCLRTYSSRRGGASNSTQASLLPCSAFYIFLAGRSTPEISSTFAIKGTFKPQ